MLKTVSSITNAIGALNFKGTWDANANSPALASSVGTKGDYYVVGTAGSTNLNGISNWGVGDWATFNGAVWQRVEGGADLNGVNLSVSGTATLSGGTINGVPYLNASRQVITSDKLSFSQSGGTFSTTFNINSLLGAANYKGGVVITEDDAAFKLYGGSDYTLIDTIGFSTPNQLRFWTSNVQRMRLDGGDLILVGSTAQKATGTTWSNPSDIRLKTNVKDYSKGTAELMQVRVCEWEYNGKGGTVEGTKGLGVIADEIMQVLPDTVTNYKDKLEVGDEETTDIKKFDATEITWLLVKAVQEQQSQIESLKAQINELKGV